MKTILCYGDSNTWGYDPVSKGCLGLLAQVLGINNLKIREILQ